mmetsp:Transcript_54162/g.144369  ORF Transcript_54162/g.144369 Transcript_54162/m.144369 type:complete len:203 (-) Transcript_54162:326-934(-)
MKLHVPFLDTVLVDFHAALHEICLPSFFRTRGSIRNLARQLEIVRNAVELSLQLLDFSLARDVSFSTHGIQLSQAPVGFALLDLTRLLLADSLLKLVRFRKEVHPICSVLARKTLALLQALEYFDDQLVLVLHNHAVDDLENTHENFIDLGLLAELRTRCRSSLALDCCHRSRSDVSFSARRQDRQQRRHWCSPHWQFRHGL